jgi:hypothetical protein
VGPSSVALAHGLCVVLLRALATATVVALGFSAISDDDFARLVIAQSFAESPRLDPSGTSWLPFPFWLTGSVMALAGPSVEMARGFAFATSLLSSLGVFVAAHWAGLERNAAWTGALLAALLPHAVWLGAATVPDGYSATLALLAASSACTLDPRRRWLGALAITLAALSRYEAWPVAMLLCSLGVFDAFVQRDRSLLWPALGALVGPLAWLLHGAYAHDDALFFLKRVADYRRAVGRSPVDVVGSIFGYPKVLLRAEPELVAVATLAFFRHRHALPPATARFALVAFAALAFLVLGDLGDGAPTHHPERPLLLIWLICCLLLGHALTRSTRRFIGGLLVVAVGAFALRPIVTRRDDFIDRSAEVEIGRAARGPVGNARLLVDTDDYAYFAVLAGFERAARGQPLREHDPRLAEVDPWSSPTELRRRLRDSQAAFLIAGTDKLPKLADFGSVVLATERYALIELRKEAP